jgi:hypothetical protein
MMTGGRVMTKRRRRSRRKAWKREGQCQVKGKQVVQVVVMERVMKRERRGGVSRRAARRGQMIQEVTPIQG